MKITGERAITRIFAQEIKDSRGTPTLKVTVEAGPHAGSFSVPSGASTGSQEAYELRDGDGKGVQGAILKINEVISPTLVGLDVFNQQEIDEKLIALDATPNKSCLGGNAMIGVSIACAKAAALVAGKELWEYLQTLEDIQPSRSFPLFYMNLINGGKHAKNDLAFQEYHIVPETDNAETALRAGIEIQESLKLIIEKNLGKDSVVMGDEGGFAPKISDIRQPLVYLNQAILEAGWAGKVRLALDVASSSFYQNGQYKIGERMVSSKELLGIYGDLIKEFKLLSIEDPFYEEDFENFKNLKEGEENLLVVGDDLTVTNKDLVAKAISTHSINAMIIKPNQIGTLSETLATMKLARDNGIELIVSHRSGETDDDFIADLAYAYKCFGIKAGAPSKPERMIKYRRLINISRQL